MTMYILLKETDLTQQSMHIVMLYIVYQIIRYNVNLGWIII